MKEDYNFIKNFTKIKIKTICNDLKINRTNIIQGTAKEEKITKVKKELEKRLISLLIGENNNE